MAKPLAIPSGLFILFSFVVHALISVQVSRGLVWASPFDGHGFFCIITIIFSLSVTVYQTITTRRARFRVAIAFQIFAVLALMHYLTDSPLLRVLIGATLVLSVSLFERYPLNLVLGVFFSIMVGTIGVLDGIGRATGDAVLIMVTQSLILTVLTVACGSTIKYRERLIDLQTDYTRLDHSLNQISRTNAEFQDMLVRVEADSVEQERHRITRDIHDIVGYTLTNNIMLMEAATDLARTNPLGVTRLLNIARENAEDGLKRIRSTLYTVRKREEIAPHGITAIARLAGNFQAATGIEVHTDFANTPVVLSHSIEVMLYHLVQEAMTNSFRHGRATRIDITISIVGGTLRVSIFDNGIGADHLDEGIGLKGMAERVSRLGGSVRYQNVPKGFMVTAIVPWEETR